MPRSLVIALIGVAVAAYAAWHYYEQLGPLRGWPEAEATVRGTETVEADTPRGKRTVVYVLATYDGPDGESREARMLVRDAGSYPEGRTVPILYNPGDGAQAVVGGFWTFTGMPLTFGAIGIAVFLFGMILVIRERRRRPRS